jgi:hypothetical protein
MKKNPLKFFGGSDPSMPAPARKKRDAAELELDPRLAGPAKPKAPPVEPDAARAAAERAAKQQQCPSCFGGLGGTGQVYASAGLKHYTRCGTCGFTWVVDLSPPAKNTRSGAPAGLRRPDGRPWI